MTGTPTESRQQLELKARDFMVGVVSSLLAIALAISFCSIEPQQGFWAGIENAAYTFGTILAFGGSLGYWTVVGEIVDNPAGDAKFLPLVPLAGFVGFVIRCTLGGGGPTLWNMEFIRTGWLWAHGAFHLELSTGWVRGAVPRVVKYIVEKKKGSVGE